MRIRANIIRNGQWDNDDGGVPFVSDATRRAYSDPTCALFLRESGDRRTSGAIFLFAFPPQSMTYERDANVNVSTTRHGYVVSENGLGAPTITIAGHHGWRMREVELPETLKVSLAPKSNVTFDRNLENYWIPLSWISSPEADQIGEKIFNGQNIDIVNFRQELDGRSAYMRMQDIIVFYYEENQKRIAQGKRTLEMVWFDPLHSIRWVVVPRHPILKRSKETQGTHPYQIEMIGVYDDTRRRQREGDTAWSYNK